MIKPIFNSSRMIDIIEAQVTADHYDNLERGAPGSLDKFYSRFKPLRHPRTGKPVKKMTRYQRKIWNDIAKHKRVLCIKGQKIGMTTLCCLKVIQMAQGECRGRQIMVVGPSRKKARDIITMIKNLYHRSDYGDYVMYGYIPEIDGELQPKKRTTGDRIYLRNLDEPDRPTEIFAASIASLDSLSGHPDVGFVYASDIGLAKISSDKMWDHYAMMVGRLTMSDGPLLIETPPGMAEGPLWEYCKGRQVESGYGHARIDPAPGKSKDYDYWIHSYPSQVAVDAGITSRSALRALESEIENPMMFYGACFDKSGTQMQRSEFMRSIMDPAGMRKAGSKGSPDAPSYLQDMISSMGTH